MMFVVAAINAGRKHSVEPTKAARAKGEEDAIACAESCAAFA